MAHPLVVGADIIGFGSWAVYYSADGVVFVAESSGGTRVLEVDLVPEVRISQTLDRTGFQSLEVSAWAKMVDPGRGRRFRSSHRGRPVWRKSLRQDSLP